MSVHSIETPSCQVCRKHSGAFAVPGSAIYQDDLVYASHAHFPEDQDTIYLGWLVVETIRHVPGLADLTDTEAQALGLLVARLSRALKVNTGAEQIYAFVLGHHVPHLHVHLLPRYPGTPRQFWGTRVDEWPDAPRGDESQIAAFCDRLRNSLGKGA